MSSIDTVSIPCDGEETLFQRQRTNEIDRLRMTVKTSNTILHWGFGLKYKRDIKQLDTITKELSIHEWSLDENGHRFYGPRWLLVSHLNDQFMLFKYINATFIPGLNSPDNQGYTCNNVQCNYALIPLSAIIENGSYVEGYDSKGILKTYTTHNNTVATFSIRASTIQKQIKTTNEGHIKLPSSPFTSLDKYSPHTNGISMWGFHTIPTFDKAVSKQRARWITEFREAHLTKECERRIASAAILGSSMEFCCNIRRFMRYPDWRHRRIMPALGLLSETQKLAGPQPLYYWIRPDVCHKCMGEKAHGDIIEIIMRGEGVDLNKFI